MADGVNRTARWIPGWYNLDAPLELGQTGTFIFYNRYSPDQNGHGVAASVSPSDDAELVFAQGSYDDAKCHMRRVTVAGMEHPKLGPLKQITTDMFGMYELITVNDEMETVEAEQDPGHGSPELGIKNWTVHVQLSDVGVATPLPPIEEFRELMKSEGIPEWSGYRQNFSRYPPIGGGDLPKVIHNGSDPLAAAKRFILKLFRAKI